MRSVAARAPVAGGGGGGGGRRRPAAARRRRGHDAAGRKMGAGIREQSVVARRGSALFRQRRDGQRAQPVAAGQAAHRHRRRLLLVGRQGPHADVGDRVDVLPAVL